MTFLFIKNRVTTARMAKHFIFTLFDSRMPSIYHEHCGKPGPKSNEYMPPPESRLFFKSRSAPNSPLLGERKSLFPARAESARGSPRLTRGLNQLSEKLAAGKGAKFGKFGRSKSFNGKGMYLNYAGVAILCSRTYLLYRIFEVYFILTARYF